DASHASINPGGSSRLGPNSPDVCPHRVDSAGLPGAVSFPVCPDQQTLSESNRASPSGKQTRKGNAMSTRDARSSYTGRHSGKPPSRHTMNRALQGVTSAIVGLLLLIATIQLP